MTYTAAGEKITKFTAANTGIETTQNYVSGIEYNGASLEAVYHEEGRLVPNGTAWHYEYTLKDHLGNSRVMFRANGTTAQVLQENHYYLPLFAGQAIRHGNGRCVDGAGGHGE